VPLTTRLRLAYRAKASRDGTVVADSIAAVRVDTADAAPILWFPRSDVADDALAQLDPSAWSVGDEDLAGYVNFDGDQLDLVLVDAVPGGDERDTTVKRFPTWGDAADLIEVLDVQQDGAGVFVGTARSDWRRPVVEGSQMLGQAIVAAGRHAPGRRVVSASMVFTRAADARSPYAIELDEVSAGRTFSALGVRAHQGGRTCAAGTLLVDVTAPDVIRHADPAPPGPGPYDATPYDMSVTGRDLRFRDDAYTGDPDASASGMSRTTSPSTPGSWPSSPGTCRSPPPCAPTRGSARTRPTSRSRRRSTPSRSPSTPRSGPTSGCGTSTGPRSPVTA
jgi:acyl-CoA thioesterase-2